MLCRVTIFGTYGGMGHINVLHFRKDGTSDTDYFLLASKVEEFWIGAHKGNTQSHMQWNRIHVEDVFENKDPYDLPVTVQGVLGFTSSYIPWLCAVFKLKTNTGARQGRGRSHQAGYDNSFPILAGLWNTTLQTRIDNVADALTVDWANGGSLNTGGWGVVVSGRNPVDEDDAKTVINIIADSKVGSMNSRKIGRGF